MLLKLKNIGKIYNSNDILTIGIRNINLEFDYNEFVTIEGESGSGKSTLLNVIGANDTYEEGELYFNGQETSHYSESEWEKYRENNIATVFQDFNIIENLTVVENVELALFRLDDKKERRKIALELIEKVGLTKQANQRGSKLSGGEKQRTVIARALAKDSPIILADEPTGNLDVKASREVAKLLKDVSKDKLVIVVTHNPEFFEEYATRRVRVFDGKISEDEVIQKPQNNKVEVIEKDVKKKRFHDLKNIFYLGALNYKSRPKFTSMMSFALLVCAITLFIVISVFGTTLINSTVTNLDGTGVNGKVVVSSTDNGITLKELDEIAGTVNAGYVFEDKEYSEFIVEIPKTMKTLREYEVICIYSPYEYNLKTNEGVLVLPTSFKKDAEYIKDVFISSKVGIEKIEIKTSLSSRDVKLYLSHDLLMNKGKNIKAINSTVTFGEDESIVYSFISDKNVNSGEIKLINSNYWNIVGKTAVLSISSEKSYLVVDDSLKDESLNGIVVVMNDNDFNNVFKKEDNPLQACIYFENSKLAESAILNYLPDGFMGVSVDSQIYVQNAGDVFTYNILWYIALIFVSILFGVLISIIFTRSVKIFQTDFAVYRTLGISSKVSLKSLYVQMAFIFFPTIVLLPLISLIVTIIPGSTIPFISFSNFMFIEIMLLLIVELVAFGFNKNLNGQSIRKSLRRGSK